MSIAIDDRSPLTAHSLKIRLVVEQTGGSGVDACVDAPRLEVVLKCSLPTRVEDYTLKLVLCTCSLVHLTYPPRSLR
jgi:hypothetical protein